jgi:hypothetical protein
MSFLRPGSQVGKAVSLQGTTASSSLAPASTYTIHPADSWKLSAGLASGFRQRQGFLGPLSFWRDCSKKATVQNDLPQLPRRMPEVR